MCCADHGFFVLINVYAPCAYDEESKRFEFKMKFNIALDCYIAALHRKGMNVVRIYYIRQAAYCACEFIPGRVLGAGWGPERLCVPRRPLRPGRVPRHLI